MNIDRKDFLDGLCGVSEPWANMRDDDAEDDPREEEFRRRWEAVSEGD